MQQYLYKYLAIHHHLSIPGLGSFIINTYPVTVERSGKLLLPPLEVIRFTQEITPPDNNFYRFLSTELDIDDAEAVKQFHEEAASLKTAAAEPEGVLLKGIGHVKIDSEGTVFFIPRSDQQRLFPRVSLPDDVPHIEEPSTIIEEPAEAIETEALAEEVVYQEEVYEEIITGTNKNWWIYAIILLLGGIAAILFYYQ